jgi:hypothetical protein
MSMSSGWYLVILRKSGVIVISLLPDTITRLAAISRSLKTSVLPGQNFWASVSYINLAAEKAINPFYGWFQGAAGISASISVNYRCQSHRAPPNHETHNFIISTFSYSESRLLAQLLRDTFPLSSYSPSPNVYHMAYVPVRYINLPRLQASSSDVTTVLSDCYIQYYCSLSP